jgi:hypothetical protein
MIQFGSYLVATDDFHDTQHKLICEKGQLALIFSRHRQKQPANKTKPVDLLMENGKVIHGLDANEIKQHFKFVFSDPDFIICGCSTNDGWQKTRDILKMGDKHA